MNAPTRKAVGGLAILVFLALYILAVITIADRVPDQPLIKMVYFVVCGSAWGAPLIPLIRWMNRGA